MCWESKTIPIFKIAKADIIVYKILANRNTPMYHSHKLNDDGIPSRFKYIKGNPNKINSPLKLYTGYLGYYIIQEGFHFYVADKIIINHDGLIVSLAGDLFVLDENDYLAKFKIPKGARYTINCKGEGVSESIIFISSRRVRECDIAEINNISLELMFKQLGFINNILIKIKSIYDKYFKY